MTQAARIATVVVVAALAFGSGWLLRPSDPLPVKADPSRVDVGFCQDMAVHHAQAVLMAQQALDRGSTQAIRVLSKQILVGQSQERGALTGWLTTWRQPQLPPGLPMTWMPGHHGHMPGMATMRELDRLAAATGKAFDALFLRLMIQHHAGGVEMATAASERANLPEVRALAGVMAQAQIEESLVMRELLEHAR